MYIHVYIHKYTCKYMQVDVSIYVCTQSLIILWYKCMYMSTFAGTHVPSSMYLQAIVKTLKTTSVYLNVHKFIRRIVFFIHTNIFILLLHKTHTSMYAVTRN